MAETGSPLADWLRSREPGVPEAFLPRLLEDGGSSEVDPWTLYEKARGELLASLEVPGRHRVSAFRLLAADAFLTYACELMARQADPGRDLEALVRTLGRELG